MTKKAKVNGGVDALSLAMRQVFTEAMEVGVQPVKDAVDGLRSDMGELKKDMGSDMKDMRADLSGRLDTTNENMSAQFAEQEKKIGKLLKENAATL